MTSEFTIAVHALVYLNHAATTVSSEALAKNVCTNPARIRKVMAKLKKQNLITTKEGKDGGYLFTQDENTVNLQQIFQALDTRLLSTSWTSGDHNMKCLIASGMAEVMDTLYNDMEQRCLQHLSTITLADLNHKLFTSNPQKTL